MSKNIKETRGLKIIKEFITRCNIKDHFFITQNTQGVLEKTGFNENKIYEIKGNVNYF